MGGQSPVRGQSIAASEQAKTMAHLIQEQPVPDWAEFV